MKYTLMHKRIAVAEMEVDDTTGLIQKVSKVYAPEHFPVGIAVKKGAADRAALNEWWADRSIPSSRSGVREAMEDHGRETVPGKRRQQSVPAAAL